MWNILLTILTIVKIITKNTFISNSSDRKHIATITPYISMNNFFNFIFFSNLTSDFFFVFYLILNLFADRWNHLTYLTFNKIIQFLGTHFNKFIIFLFHLLQVFIFNLFHLN